MLGEGLARSVAVVVGRVFDQDRTQAPFAEDEHLNRPGHAPVAQDSLKRLPALNGRSGGALKMILLPAG